MGRYDHMRSECRLCGLQSNGSQYYFHYGRFLSTESTAGAYNEIIHTSRYEILGNGDEFFCDKCASRETKRHRLDSAALVGLMLAILACFFVFVFFPAFDSVRFNDPNFIGRLWIAAPEILHWGIVLILIIIIALVGYSAKYHFEVLFYSKNRILEEKAYWLSAETIKAIHGDVHYFSDEEFRNEMHPT